ncbi:MAG: hypothetical protein HYX24_02580 [Candidatus Aenigmarchaeota archaeon]|nr:hypothetical protein [Candidatus Aenigmarchaeota archaeon]
MAGKSFWKGRSWLKEFEEKKKRNKSVAIKALQHLYGIAEWEAKSYGDLVRAEPMFKLLGALEEAFKVSRKYGEALDDLDRAVTEYEGWLDRMRANPVAQKVAETSADFQSLKKALRSALGPEAADTSFIDTPGFSWLMNYTMLVNHTMDLYETESLGYLHDAAGHFREVFEKGGEGAAQRYVADFIWEFRKETSDPIAGTGYMTPENAIVSDIKGLLTAGQRKRVAHMIPLSAFVSNIEDAKIAHERVGKAKDAYIALGGSEELAILDCFRKAEMKGPEIVSFVADRTGRLKAHNADAHTIWHLISGAGADQKMEILDYLARRPAAASVYKGLRRVQVSAKEYNEFLLTTADIGWGLRDGSLLDLVQEIASVSGQAEAAACILRNGPDILVDPNAGRLLDIAKHYHLADLIISDYLASAAASESNKTLALLMIGEYMPSAEELKKLRQKLRQLDDGGLSWVSDSLSADQLVENLLRAERSPAKAEQTQMKSKKKRAGWHEAMMQELEKSGAGPEVVGLVRETYNSLGPSSSRRLRDIWVNRRESLEDFCRDAVGLGGTKAYELILSDYSLFLAYKSRLNDDAFRGKLHEIARSQSRNIYREIGSLLHVDIYPPAPAGEVIREAGLSAGEERPSYKRIIVWGGQYGHDVSEKIKHAVDTPVEVFDEFNRRKDISGIGQEDAVVCVVASVYHPIYYQLKRHCRKNDITFYHFGLRGHTTLVEFLQGKFGKKGAA